jgi:hypothetical protein
MNTLSPEQRMQDLADMALAFNKTCERLTLPMRGVVLVGQHETCISINNHELVVSASTEHRWRYALTVPDPRGETLYEGMAMSELVTAAIGYYIRPLVRHHFLSQTKEHEL